MNKREIMIDLDFSFPFFKSLIEFFFSLHWSVNFSRNSVVLVFFGRIIHRALACVEERVVLQCYNNSFYNL